MPQPTPHITAAELRVLKVLWRLGAGTVRQVLDALPAGGDERPAYTTVMTIMKQLAEKGGLTVDRERQPFVYTPAVRRDQVLGSRLTQFLQTVFDGQAGNFNRICQTNHNSHILTDIKSEFVQFFKRIAEL